MKKINLIFILISVFFFNINAQEVISSSGDYFVNSNGSISWTMGETITETFTDGTNILTQGFQQSRLSASSVFELEDMGITVKISPNPTQDIINLYIDNIEGINYQLYDFNGKIIKQAVVNSCNTRIFFSEFSSAAYFLKIMKGSQVINTFQIIKQ
ncbi:MAG: hypothetical protein DRI94_09255 [Bacteroidetes bacterium]|nr:MAG: hypothetical protein DRI94_09255 [Bacteroidota bacterium]